MEALSAARDEVADSRAAGDRRREARALTGLAAAELADGTALSALGAANEAKALHAAAGDRGGLAEALVLAARAQTRRGAPQAALSSLQSATEIFAERGDRLGEGRAWHWIMEARLALGKYEDALKAGEAALVIAMDIGGDEDRARTLLSVAQAHTTYNQPQKALKAGTMALDLYRRLGVAASEGAALDSVVQALLALERVEEALRQAKNGAASLEVAGHRRFAALALRSLLQVHLARGDGPQALEACSNGLKLLGSDPGDRAVAASLLSEQATIHARLQEFQAARDSATSAIEYYKELEDSEGQAQATSLLGAIEDSQSEATKDEEMAEVEQKLLLQLGEAWQDQDGHAFKDILDKLYSETRITLNKAGEFLQPYFAASAAEYDGDVFPIMHFWSTNQPDNVCAPDCGKEGFDANGTGFERNLCYYLFRSQGMMGYGPGFRMMQNIWRKGELSKGLHTQGVASLNTKDDCEDWEEKVGYHPGLLDCALQAGMARGHQAPHSVDLKKS